MDNRPKAKVAGRADANTKALVMQAVRKPISYFGTYIYCSHQRYQHIFSVFITFTSYKRLTPLLSRLVYIFVSLFRPKFRGGVLSEPRLFKGIST